MENRGAMCRQKCTKISVFVSVTDLSPKSHMTAMTPLKVGCFKILQYVINEWLPVWHVSVVHYSLQLIACDNYKALLAFQNIIIHAEIIMTVTALHVLCIHCMVLC